MKDKNIDELLKTTEQLNRADREAVNAWQNRIISGMVDAARQETNRLEHHLLEMPLSVILYQWIIIRLKSRPWRLLVPASLAMALLLQGILARFNLVQFLTH